MTRHRRQLLAGIELCSMCQNDGFVNKTCAGAYYDCTLNPRDCMITIRQNTSRGRRAARRLLLLVIVYASHAVAAEPRPAKVAIGRARNAHFAHLTTETSFRANREARADSRPGNKNFQAQGGDARVRDLKFNHLTTNDGLSQGYVPA